MPFLPEHSAQAVTGSLGPGGRQPRQEQRRRAAAAAVWPSRRCPSRRRLHAPDRRVRHASRSCLPRLRAAERVPSCASRLWEARGGDRTPEATLACTVLPANRRVAAKLHHLTGPLPHAAGPSQNSIHHPCLPALPLAPPSGQTSTGSRRASRWVGAAQRQQLVGGGRGLGVGCYPTPRVQSWAVVGAGGRKAKGRPPVGRAPSCPLGCPRRRRSDGRPGRPPPPTLSPLSPPAGRLDRSRSNRQLPLPAAAPAFSHRHGAAARRRAAAAAVPGGGGGGTQHGSGQPPEQGGLL